jgi:hypothetical protein
LFVTNQQFDHDSYEVGRYPNTVRATFDFSTSTGADVRSLPAIDFYRSAEPATCSDTITVADAAVFATLTVVIIAISATRTDNALAF